MEPKKIVVTVDAPEGLDVHVKVQAKEKSVGYGQELSSVASSSMAASPIGDGKGNSLNEVNAKKVIEGTAGSVTTASEKKGTTEGMNSFSPGLDDEEWEQIKAEPTSSEVEPWLPKIRVSLLLILQRARILLRSLRQDGIRLKFSLRSSTRSRSSR